MVNFMDCKMVLSAWSNIEKKSTNAIEEVKDFKGKRCKNKALLKIGTN